MPFLENCLKLQNVAVVSKVGNKESEKAAIDVAKIVGKKIQSIHHITNSS